MSVLLLQLAGPMQAWGDSSRFTRRETRREPTKSGVVGLLASALGRTREADMSDLAALEFAVRIDQPGTVMRDFQTEIPAKGDPMPLTHRYYLADAKFLVALGGEQALLEEIDRRLGIHAGRFIWGGVRVLLTCPLLVAFMTNMATCAMPWRESPGLPRRGSETVAGLSRWTSLKSCAMRVRANRPNTAPIIL